MSEIMTASPFTLDRYQQEVESTQRNKFGEDWKDEFAKLIQSEAFEFYFQHGPSLLSLLPKGFVEDSEKERIAQNYPDITGGMAEELGDLLWFSFSAANKIGKQAKDLCVETLTRVTSDDIGPIRTFQELQDSVITSAPRIIVPTKLALSGHVNRGDNEELHYVSLEDNPFYVSQRMLNRLIRSLQLDKKELLPPTASSMEPMIPLEQALGDFIITIVYLSKKRAGVDIGEVAQRNIQKLKLREISTKE